VYNLHVPQVTKPDSRTAWRILNRTLYREKDVCTPEQLHWQRRVRKETALMTEIRSRYGLIAYPDDLFYKTHKISHQDLLDKLESSEDAQAEIAKLFDDESHGTGRRGVLSLKKAVKLVNQKLQKKEKLRAFARKFTDEQYSSSRELR